VTVLLGIIGIKHTFKYRKKTELIFLKITSTYLFRDIVKSLDDIEVKFQGTKIDEDLILFKGGFFNSGNVDIDKTLVHKPLELELSENYEWKDFKIVKSSDGLQLDFLRDIRKITFDWDLFKEGEYFIFNSLVEFKRPRAKVRKPNGPRLSLLSSLKINQRITDLKEVKKENSVPSPTLLSLSFLSFTLGCILMAIGTIGFFSPTISQDNEVYSEIKIGKTSSFVKFNAKEIDQISLIDSHQKEVAVLRKDSVSKLLTGKIIIKKAELSSDELIISSIITLFGLLIAVYSLKSYLNLRNRIKKFKDIQQEGYGYNIMEDVFFKFFLFRHPNNQSK